LGLIGKEGDILQRCPQRSGTRGKIVKWGGWGGEPGARKSLGIGAVFFTAEGGGCGRDGIGGPVKGKKTILLGVANAQEPGKWEKLFKQTLLVVGRPVLVHQKRTQIEKGPRNCNQCLEVGDRNKESQEALSGMHSGGGKKEPGFIKERNIGGIVYCRRRCVA